MSINQFAVIFIPSTASNLFFCWISADSSWLCSSE